MFLLTSIMPRLNLPLPPTFSFTTIIPVRITDINYGGHAGNDSILSMIHECRFQYLHSLGYSELNFENVGLIMGDVAIEFKAEVFYGDQLTAYITAIDFLRSSFDFYYKFEKASSSGQITVVKAKTGMVCFDYNQKRIVSVPARAKELLQG